MKYTYESQVQALNYLIKNAPHDIEKFEKLYNVESEIKDKAKVDLHDILFSDVWSVDEKAALIKLYEYNDKENTLNNEWNSKSEEQDEEDEDYDLSDPLIDQCIKKNNLSGVQALLKSGCHISTATIARIIKYVTNPRERYKYCQTIVKHYENSKSIEAYEDCVYEYSLRQIPSLCDIYYSDCIAYTAKSSMSVLCRTNDLRLIKLFLPTVKDIKSLFMYAVESGNVDIAKLFIEFGADVNFKFINEDEHIFTSPLKIAIDNNDLKMIKFLRQNGADLNFVDKSERIQRVIENLENEDIDNKEEILGFLKLTPFNYAIMTTEEPVYLSLQSSLRQSYAAKSKIVKYLYNTEATLGEQAISYTDLICFSIKAIDFPSTVEYYFEEARLNGSKLDFAKIISSIQDDTSSPSLLKVIEAYAKMMDSENYKKDIKLMLKKIFDLCAKKLDDFCYYDGKYRFYKNNPYFDTYKKLIFDFSKKLPKEMLKDIPAVFYVGFDNLEAVVNLGYDINCIENGCNIYMYYIREKQVIYDTLPSIRNSVLSKLADLGANINYINPENGESALSLAIKYMENNITSRENNIKELLSALIDLSDQTVIQSYKVADNLCSTLKPGYLQMLYNDIIEKLCKKGFKVDDYYVIRSLEYLDKNLQLIQNAWGYLYNLYNNFKNDSLKTYANFPNIEDVKEYEYGTDESNRIFDLIVEHINRNFVTSIEQIDNPEKVVKNYSVYENKPRLQTMVELQQDMLIKEIERYVGFLDYRLIMELLNMYPFIDDNTIIRNALLKIALQRNDLNLCKELMKRGISIIFYDENGKDITKKVYTRKQIDTISYLEKNYMRDSDEELNGLLSEIGIDDKSLKKVNKDS